MKKTNDDSLIVPPRPDKLSIDLIETPKSLTIVKRRGAGGGGCFLLLWLTGWTVGCVFLAGQVIADPNLGMLAFAIPFWASWFAVASFLIWIWFGKEMFQAHTMGVSFERYAWIRLSARETPRKEILGFEQCRSHHTENDRYLYGIEMKTQGKPLRFLFDLPDNERRWLVFKLNEFFSLREESITADVPMELASPQQQSEVLTVDNTLVQPPSSNRWTKITDFDALRFRRRGKFSWGAFFGLLFINLFWNGIVSVFILALFGFMPGGGNGMPQGIGWWGIFVFLIPFEVIGFVMLFGFVSNLLEPLHTITWSFESNSIHRQSKWPFLNLQKRWEIDSLDRIELRAEDEDRSSNKMTVSFETGSSFKLVCVNQENQEVCTLDELTQGEAKWIAHHFIKYRSNWFPQ